MIAWRGWMVVVAWVLVLAPSFAHANERHFTYTYESSTLPAGNVELEPWTTWRVGRERYYNRFDHRLEFEYGITDRLQTALYLNFSAVAAGGEMNTRTSSFNYGGVSSEWKLRVLDSGADPVGLAFYLEVTGEPEALELEQKVILDVRSGDWLFATNLVAEQEVGFAPDETEVEYVFVGYLALGYFLSEQWMIGLEFRNHTDIAHGDFEHSAFFIGPVASYATEGYWVALSVLPQIGAIKPDSAPDGDFRDLEGHEMLNARLLLGFPL